MRGDRGGVVRTRAERGELLSGVPACAGRRDRRQDPGFDVAQVDGGHPGSRLIGRGEGQPGTTGDQVVRGREETCPREEEAALLDRPCGHGRIIRDASVPAQYVGGPALDRASTWEGRVALYSDA